MISHSYEVKYILRDTQFESDLPIQAQKLEATKVLFEELSKPIENQCHGLAPFEPFRFLQTYAVGGREKKYIHQKIRLTVGLDNEPIDAMTASKCGCSYSDKYYSPLFVSEQIYDPLEVLTFRDLIRRQHELITMNITIGVAPLKKAMKHRKEAQESVDYICGDEALAKSNLNSWLWGYGSYLVYVLLLVQTILNILEMIRAFRSTPEARIPVAYRANAYRHIFSLLYSILPDYIFRQEMLHSYDHLFGATHITLLVFKATLGDDSPETVNKPQSPPQSLPESVVSRSGCVQDKSTQTEGGAPPLQGASLKALRQTLDGVEGRMVVAFMMGSLFLAAVYIVTFA